MKNYMKYLEISCNTGNNPSINKNVPQQEVDEIKDGENSSVKSTSPKPVVLKHERPKLPQFLGDVRKYFMFKADLISNMQLNHNVQREIPSPYFTHAWVQSPLS